MQHIYEKHLLLSYKQFLCNYCQSAWSKITSRTNANTSNISFSQENKIFAVRENSREVESRWLGLCFLLVDLSEILLQFAFKAQYPDTNSPN